jgi:hypothetical protein
MTALKSASFSGKPGIDGCVVKKAHFCDRYHIASAAAELSLLFVDR